MNGILQFVFDILKVPAVLVGVVALIGLIAQKKPLADTIRGTIKTILGFIVLGGGAGVLVGSLNLLGDMFQHAFSVQGIVPNNEAIVSIALKEYGTATALIMAFGMVANILIARFTRLKYIFLTGHHTFYMACMIGVILTVAGFKGFMLVLGGISIAALCASKLSRVTVNNPPRKTESIVFQLPTPVMISSTAPSRMARVDTSPTDPGISPINISHSFNGCPVIP